MPLKIEKMYAFVAVDQDGNEGILAAEMNGVMMPLLGADLSRVDAIRKLAQKVSDQTGTPHRLVHFETRTELETYPVMN